MEKEIIDKLSEHNLAYAKINEDNLLPIYNIFFHNMIDNTNETDLYLLYLGVYYEYLISNNELAEKYYLMAIEKNNVPAMNALAGMYKKQKKYDSAEKYYLMAIENNYDKAMFNLAIMYTEQKKYDLAEKYYLMAVKNNITSAMNNLANIYLRQNKYELAEKYYLMAIENKQTLAMFNMAVLYDWQEKYILAEKYYLIAIENNYTPAINNLAHIYGKQKKYVLAEKYYLMAIDKNNIDAMYDLASLYEIQNKYNLAEQYFLLAALNYHTESRKKINEILDKEFNIELAIKAESFLDNKNNQRLNQILVYVHKNKNSNFGGRLVDNMDCTSCGNTGTIIFMNCSHPLCINCYVKNKTCHICS